MTGELLSCVISETWSIKRDSAFVRMQTRLCFEALNASKSNVMMHRHLPASEVIQMLFRHKMS